MKSNTMFGVKQHVSHAKSMMYKHVNSYNRIFMLSRLYVLYVLIHYIL